MWSENNFKNLFSSLELLLYKENNVYIFNEILTLKTWTVDSGAANKVKKPQTTLLASAPE